MSLFKIVSKEKWIAYWIRAAGFHKAMQKEESTDVAVSNAVHCAISAIDALSILKNGKKSSGEHYNSLSLIKEIRTSDDAERSRIISKLQELIPLKNKGEYGDTNPSKKDAEKALDLSRDIFNFVEKELRLAGVL
jgi:HEPN domain-containing protein